MERSSWEGNKKGPHGPDGLRHPPPECRINYKIGQVSENVKVFLHTCKRKMETSLSVNVGWAPPTKK